jgi:hypothetical protein
MKTYAKNAVNSNFASSQPAAVRSLWRYVWRPLRALRPTTRAAAVVAAIRAAEVVAGIREAGAVARRILALRM